MILLIERLSEECRRFLLSGHSGSSNTVSVCCLVAQGRVHVYMWREIFLRISRHWVESGRRENWDSADNRWVLHVERSSRRSPLEGQAEWESNFLKEKGILELRCEELTCGQIARELHLWTNWAIAKEDLSFSRGLKTVWSVKWLRGNRFFTRIEKIRNPRIREKPRWFQCAWRDSNPQPSDP